MSPALWISLAAGALVCLLAVVFLVVAGAARKAEARMEKLLNGESVLRRSNGANFRGFSAASVKVRGNGILVLTPTRLVFVMWVSKISLELPLSHVDGASVERPDGTTGEALTVRYRTRDGKTDRSQWIVEEPAGWVEALRSLPGRNS